MSRGAWQDSCSTIESALNYMWRNEIVVDTEFKHENGRSLYAHKLVLALWSPAFADWLTMKGNICKVKIEDNYETMKIVLRYMYSSDQNISLPKMSVDQLMRVFEVAERYKIVQLREKCLSLLSRRKIDPYNVIEFFDFGIRKNNSQICNKCHQVFKDNGMVSTQIREQMPLVSILGILTQERIAASSEVLLLRMAIKWLSFPNNACHKSEILSFIDLSAIEWAEYQSILRDSPDFFSEKELLSILSAVSLSDTYRFPEWYRPRVASFRHTCPSCTHVVKRINSLALLNVLPINNAIEANSKVSYTFRIVYRHKVLARLVRIELGFGPKHVSETDFSVTYRIHNIGRSGIIKPCTLDSIQSQNANNYVIILNERAEVQTNDRVTVTFDLENSFKANYIKIIHPIASERQRLRKVDTKDTISVSLTSVSPLLIFVPQNGEQILLVTAVTFRFCENHAEYLQRKIISPKLLKPPVKKLKTDHCYPVDISNIKKEDKSFINLE